MANENFTLQGDANEEYSSDSDSIMSDFGEVSLCYFYLNTNQDDFTSFNCSSSSCYAY